jgi:hypothetical protein
MLSNRLFGRTRPVVCLIVKNSFFRYIRPLDFDEENKAADWLVANIRLLLLRPHLGNVHGGGEQSPDEVTSLGEL